MKYSALLLTLAASLTTSAWAADLSKVHEGDIYLATLAELKPTQPSAGFDQVYYKLGRYQKDVEKQFDEICEANGQKGVRHFDEHSQPAVADSFECKKEVGAKRKDMKTVVIAPDNSLYLTDGHHTFNTFWHMSGGGSNFPVNVIVTKDYRSLPSMEAFWTQLEKDKNTWLFDVNDQPISHEQLPKALDLSNFSNDPYRSLMYFAREISWDKPDQPVPFLEFYWAKQLKPNLDLSKFDLNSAEGYTAAIKQVSELILQQKTDNVGGSGLSARAMGQFKHLKQKKFKKLAKSTSKMNYMLAYKASLNANK